MSKCQDPCPGTCGLNAKCYVVNHNPICSCPAGYNGDPFRHCQLIPGTQHHHFQAIPREQTHFKSFHFFQLNQSLHHNHQIHAPDHHVVRMPSVKCMVTFQHAPAWLITSVLHLIAGQNVPLTQSARHHWHALTSIASILVPDHVASTPFAR